MKMCKRYRRGGTLTLVPALDQLGSMMRALSEFCVSHRRGCNLSLGSALGSAWFQLDRTVKWDPKATPRVQKQTRGGVLGGGGVSETLPKCFQMALEVLGGILEAPRASPGSPWW